MIDYKNDYINLVVLGNFNPSILTHDFLVKECRLDIGNEPSSKSPPMPVVMSLDYDKISFFADLGRLQIMEKNCEDPKSSKLPRYLQTYLDKLPYTPITKCGANFSYRLGVDSSRMKELIHWLVNERGKFCEILKLRTVNLEVTSTVDENKETIENWTLRTKTSENQASTMLKVIMPNSVGEVKIDFNYEVAKLDTDRKRLNSITTHYGNVCDVFKYQVEKIFRE
jgi:hypothetical protein